MWGASTSSDTTVMGTENDIEIKDPPNSIVSAMEFSSYQTIRKNFLAASCHDLKVHLWEVRRSRETERKSVVSMTSLILDVAWSIDGKGLYMASSDNQLKYLVLERPDSIADAREVHNGPVKTCNVIKETNFRSCVMTGSLDNTVKIWDARIQRPVVTINMPDKVACADVDDTMAVVCTERGNIFVYELGTTMELVSDVIPPLQGEPRSVSIFRDRRTEKPGGFSIGTLEDCVLKLHTENPLHEAVLFSNSAINLSMTQPVNFNDTVNDIKYHPVHHTLAVVRSNGHYSCYNDEAIPTMLSDKLCRTPIMKCCFNRDGTIFAYNTCHDISKRPISPPSIFLNYGCFYEMDPAVYYLNYI